MVHYSLLFKRASSILRSRYRIILETYDWKELEPWLKQQLYDFDEMQIQTQEELNINLEHLRRQSPTKFYLLELDLIKELRKRCDTLKKTPIKKAVEKIGIVDNHEKKKRDDDKEGSGNYIYIE